MSYQVLVMNQTNRAGRFCVVMPEDHVWGRKELMAGGPLLVIRVSGPTAFEEAKSKLMGSVYVPVAEGDPDYDPERPKDKLVSSARWRIRFSELSDAALDQGETEGVIDLDEATFMAACESYVHRTRLDLSQSEGLGVQRSDADEGMAFEEPLYWRRNRIDGVLLEQMEDEKAFLGVENDRWP